MNDQEQPTRASTWAGRKNPIQRDKYDTSELNLEYRDGYWVHRDYAAHYFRNGFAQRYAYGKRVLELGCGSRTPLAYTLLASTAWTRPGTYVGVDYGKIKRSPGVPWVTTYELTDATSTSTREMLLETHGQFDVVVAFEIIEHMPIESGMMLLQNIASLITDDGCALISTPVFNGRRALNHVHEYGIDELTNMINSAGLEVDERMGTFMNIAELKKAINSRFDEHVASALHELVKECGKLYGNDVLANWFAPAFPDHSRNNVWKVVKA